MSDDPGRPIELAVACTLTPGELEQRRRWVLPGLLARARAREAVAGGFRWRFEAGGDVLREAAAVIDAERACCRFLRFHLTVEPEGGPIVLEVTGPRGTEDFLAALLDLEPRD